MPIQVATFLIPKNGANWFVLEDTYLRGGMRVAIDATARDALHPSCKKVGMFVLTQNDNRLWQLQADLTYIEYNPSAFYTHTQIEASDTWNVIHNKGSIKFIYNVYEGSYGVITPDTVTVVDSTSIDIRFKVPISGHATFAFDLLP